MENISIEEANKRFYLIDRFGLIKNSLGESEIRDDLREFVQADEEWTQSGEIGLLDVVRQVKPTVLIGCSTHAKAFTEDVVKEMARWPKRPIILPLSNPSCLAEVDPKDANDWSNGKALLASGSPFPPCKTPNEKDYM